MKQVYLLLTFFLISGLGFAQAPKDYTSKKYLAGAVPEVDGKVMFTHVISLEGKSTSDIFDDVYAWNQKRYGKSPSRVLFSDKEKLQIASLGYTKLSFKESALYVDESEMIYQITSVIKDNKLEVTISNIKFQYVEALKPQLFRAEEMITDKIAIKKNGQVLSRYYDKFRAHAIDAVEVVFQSLDDSFAGSTVDQRVATRDIPRQMLGYKQVGIDKLPSNISKLLGDKLALLSAKGVNAVVDGGSLEVVDGESIIRVATPKVVNADDVYTISFYTEIYRDALQNGDLSPLRTPSGGGAFSEAWMIIECKKTKKTSPMYSAPTLSGEIVNVWIK